MAQTHYSPYTVQGGQVPSTQTDFPVLVSVTDNRLKTIGNGGNVADPSGFDIRPYADSALSTPFAYQLETHGSSTGELIMRVKVPSLADSSVIYIGYGDAALNTDGSSTAVWDSNAELIWRLNESAGGAGSIIDQTANGHDGTDHDSPTFGASGKIAQGVSFFGDYIDVSGLSMSGDCTLSFWFSTSDTVGTRRLIDLAQAAATGINIAHDATTGTISLDNSGGPTSTVSSGAGFNDGQFHRVSVSRSGTTYTFYLDGSTVGTSGGTAPTYTRLFLAVEQGLTAFAAATLDQVEVADTARSANWLTTEYNNQFAPGTFAVLGSESEAGAAGPTPVLRGPIQSNLIWR